MNKLEKIKKLIKEDEYYSQFDDITATNIVMEVHHPSKGVIVLERKLRDRLCQGVKIQLTKAKEDIQNKLNELTKEDSPTGTKSKNTNK